MVQHGTADVEVARSGPQESGCARQARWGVETRRSGTDRTGRTGKASSGIDEIGQAGQARRVVEEK